MDLHELGRFLRTRRARIKPADAGLLAGPRRRVPGLRRDEVANLAGASVDYYTELERGRGAQPSAQMLAALARSLRLTGDERDHLFYLAGRPLPSTHGLMAHIQPAMLDLLDRLRDTPALVITDLHETLAQNRLGTALIGRPPSATGFAASYAYRWFTEPTSRELYPAEDHEHHSRMFTADLRAAVARRGNDPQTARMIADLHRLSPEFAKLWATGDVALRRAERKRIRHPSLGVIELDCLTLFSEDGRQRLLWFAPSPGTEAVQQLQLLSVLGSQDLGPEMAHSDLDPNP